MSHHPQLRGPKWDQPDAGDQPAPSYDPSVSGYPLLKRRPGETPSSHLAQSDDPSPASYPVLPRPSGLTRPLPRRQRGYYGHNHRRVFQQLQLLLWLVNVLVILYCIYYLWPFPPLVLFGITIHP